MKNRLFDWKVSSNTICSLQMLSYECLRATFELLIYNVKIVFSKLLDKSTVFSNMPGLNASNFSNDLMEVRKFDAQLDESGVNRWKSFIYFGKSMFFPIPKCMRCDQINFVLFSICKQFPGNISKRHQNERFNGCHFGMHENVQFSNIRYNESCHTSGNKCDISDGSTVIAFTLKFKLNFQQKKKNCSVFYSLAK